MRYQQWEQERGSPELARELRHAEQQERDDEAYERGAAEKPMAEQVAAVNEELLDPVIDQLMKDGEWHSLLLTDREAACDMMAIVQLDFAKKYDKENRR